MNEFYQEVKRCLSQGKEAVLATIIASSGSTPRKAGSQMLVKADGSIKGSVGGGAVEYQAINAALETMGKKKSCRKEFSLTRQQAGDIGMVCGGRTTIYFQYLSPQNREFLQVWDRLLKALERREEGWLLLDITREESWEMEIYIREKIYDVFHNLEAGDRVLLANVQGGQSWVILSKYYATELDELLEQNGG